MDGTIFDRIAKRLGSDASRRTLLGGLLGMAALAGATGSEAKKNNSRGRRRNNGNNGNGNGNNGGGAGTEKVQICHRTNGRRGFRLITVGAPAVPAHERHGDTVCDEPEDDCVVVTGCDDDGACTTGPAPEGTPCDAFFPAAGVCNAEGECEELPIAPG